MTPQIPPPAQYEIDPSRSTVTFRTRHLFGLAPVRGSFAIQSGTVHVTQPLSDSSIQAQIDTASFRTGNPMRDGMVRSERFLDADRYPVMTFAGHQVTGPAITGTLTVGDVTRPVSLSVERSEATPSEFTALARTRIDRTEFGVTAARGLAGRYLDMTVEVRCVPPSR